MDIRRMVTGKGFWLGVFGAVLVLGLGMLLPEYQKNTPLETGTFLTALAGSFASRTFLFCLPVTAVLPYGDAYLRDREYGFVKFLLVRRCRKEYVADKVLAVTAGSLLLWLLAGMTALLLAFLIFYPREAPGPLSFVMVGELPGRWIRTGIVGAILANLGGMAGALTHSLYMACGFPIVFYYGLIILQERYLEGIRSWNPACWILAEGDWGQGNLGLLLFLLLFLGVSVIFHQKSLQFRLKEL